MSDPDHDALYFETPKALRAWFEAHHDRAREAWIGFRKKRTGRPSVTWPEAVDQALAFGWIDGVRQSVDAEHYRIRFTPRKPGSVWSRVNLQRFAVLNSQGLVTPAGQRAFDAGDHRADHYSYENEARAFEGAESARFQAEPAAWAWFNRQPPSYRKAAAWWVLSAKKPETRERRLGRLISASAAGQRLW